MPFRTLADAMVLRNHLIHVLEEADVEENPELRRQLLTFVVGGGGFSGVEVMAELNDFVRSVKKNYLRLRNEPHRCVIVQAGDRILPEMSETLAIFAQRILRKRGVEIILNDRVKSATSERAILQSDNEIPCKTLISTVPSALPPVIQKLDCPNERGKLLVNTRLELKNYEGKVWALGDVLIFPKADFDKLRQSVPAFGDVFGELVKRRSLEGAPHSFLETAGCCGDPIPTPVAESELGPPPGFAPTEVS